jgi:hypothetical protein
LHKAFNCCLGNFQYAIIPDFPTAAHCPTYEDAKDELITHPWEEYQKEEKKKENLWTELEKKKFFSNIKKHQRRLNIDGKYKKLESGRVKKLCSFMIFCTTGEIKNNTVGQEKFLTACC